MSQYRIGVRPSTTRLTEAESTVSMRLSLAEAIALIEKLGLRHHEDNGLAAWFGEILVPMGPKTGARFAMQFTLTVDQWGTTTLGCRSTEAHHFARFLVELREEFPIVVMPVAV